MKEPEASAEHKWLLQFLGEWECEARAGEFTSKGTEVVRSLGELWIVGEGRGEMPGGGTALSVLTLGYDPARGSFVGTWVGSMMTHLWVYEGRLDGNTLVLDTEGPDMQAPGRMMRYQERIEMVDPQNRVWSSYGLGEDGSWQPFMTMRMKRK